MNSLNIRLFGTFQVEINQSLVQHFYSDKSQALLAYLVIEAGQVHRREHLATLLWGEQPDKMARANLRQTLFQLKKTLGPLLNSENPALVISPKTVQFSLNPHTHKIGTLTFDQLWQTCQAHPHQTLSPCAVCRPRLAQAAVLYQGDFLAGLNLEASPAFDAWRLMRQEGWHRQMMLLLEALIDHHMDTASYQTAQSYLCRLLALEPWHEPAHRRLIEALALNGQRLEALAHFNICQQTLQTELGLTPDDETLALVNHLRTGIQGGPAKTVTSNQAPPSPALPPPPLQDWGNMPNVPHLYGRQHELTRLKQWILDDQCRLIAVLGLGGVGKTALTAHLVQSLTPHFQGIFWRSLLNANPLDDWLETCLQTLSGQTLTSLPQSPDERLNLLFTYLNQNRYLLILDNVETVLESGRAGHFKAGYQDYGQLFQRMGQTAHQSCLLLTSRELPHHLSRLIGPTAPARRWSLAGLPYQAGQQLLQKEGLRGSPASIQTLVQRYSGNPLALQLVTRTIQDLFEIDIDAFLADETLIFDDIRDVLDQQFERLSPLEQEILLWLAIEREPLSEHELANNLLQRPPRRQMLEALGSLQRRSLLMRQAPVDQGPAGQLSDRPAAPRQANKARFTLQNVVIEYLTDYLVEHISAEIRGRASREEAASSGKISNWLNRFALLKTEVKEYVRQSQVRLILTPIANSLLAQLGRADVEQTLKTLLRQLQTDSDLRPGYAGGNILNLLLHMKIDLRGYDFSGLTLRQAYLQGMALPEVNFSGAVLAECTFTDIFNTPLSLAFNAAGTLLIAGMVSGDIYIWQVTGQLTHILKGHRAAVRCIALSPDDQWLASCGEEKTIRLWNLGTGVCEYELTDHADKVFAVAFHPGGQYLASSSDDCTIRLWQTESYTVEKVLHGHTSWVRSLAFSPDGSTLASAGFDHIVQL